MSYYTKNLSNFKHYNSILNISDSNISVHSFIDNYSINNQLVKLFVADLFFDDNHCPKCSTLNPKLYVNDYKVSFIKLPAISGFNAYLKLRKTRYKCTHCNSTFIPATHLVDKGCFISKNTKQLVAKMLCENLTITHISKYNNVSTNTTSRVIDSFAKQSCFNAYKTFLPKVLHFDEFKSLNNISGSMSFLMVDGINHQIIDIVENRQLHFLVKYFAYYTKEALANVEYICIDMYTPYMELIKQVFPNAKIILDRFHIFQNLTRAFNKTRISIMKEDKRNYLKLKNCWKLLLQSRTDLSLKYYKQRTFNYKWMSNKERVDYLIDNNTNLKNNYQVYQDILYTLKVGKIDQFKELINQEHHEISDYLKTCLKTFQKYQDMIIESLQVVYNNGVIEGQIAKIKRLKTISCGFRSFHRMRTRIMMMEGLIKVKY